MQRETSDRDPKPDTICHAFEAQPEPFAFDGDECTSNSCLGCGERVRHNEMVIHLEDGLVHEGCELDPYTDAMRSEF